MQAVKETIECSKCGCIALPDATRCPKCGASYNGSRTKEIAGTIGYLPNPAILEEIDTKVVRAYYQLTCHRHGKILVKSTVTGSPIKCPFC